jgi:hypothetical protein
MFCDYNGDGLPDLFVANDQKAQDLYMNLGHGKFKNVSDTTGAAFDPDGKLIAGMGVDWGDYTNEGRFDLLVGTYSNQPKCLFHNEGHQLFVNEAPLSGLAAPSLTALTFGAKFVDFDNDGLLDIVLVNGHVQSMVERVDSTTTYRQSSLLFHNTGAGQFKEIANTAGADFTRKIVGRGIAVGDFDGDGREDMLIVDAEGAPLLLHNDGPINHFINLRCLDRNGKSDALGALVTVQCGPRRQIGEIRSSGSYLSSDAPGLHFGLGDSLHADTVTVRWPDQKVSKYSGVAANHSYVIDHEDNSLKLMR